MTHFLNVQHGYRSDYEQGSRWNLNPIWSNHRNISGNMFWGVHRTVLNTLQPGRSRPTFVFAFCSYLLVGKTYSHHRVSSSNPLLARGGVETLNLPLCWPVGFPSLINSGFVLGAEVRCDEKLRIDFLMFDPGVYYALCRKAVCVFVCQCVSLIVTRDKSAEWVH